MLSKRIVLRYFYSRGSLRGSHGVAGRNAGATAPLSMPAQADDVTVKERADKTIIKDQTAPRDNDKVIVKEREPVRTDEKVIIKDK